jgi:hypothetical protein
MRLQDKKKAIEDFLLEHRREMSREWMALPREERTNYPHETWRNFLEKNGIERASQYWGGDCFPPAEYDYKRSMEEGYWGFGGKKWLLQDGTPAVKRNHIIVNDPVWNDWALNNGARKNDFFSQGPIEIKRWWGLRIPKEFALKILVLKFI